MLKNHPVACFCVSKSPYLYVLISSKAQYLLKNKTYALQKYFKIFFQIKPAKENLLYDRTIDTRRYKNKGKKILTLAKSNPFTYLL